jgi:hypothetical protein
MNAWANDFHFTVEKPAPPISPWSVGIDQAYQSDENLKKQYGIELAKTANAFEAACKIFGEEESKALWVSFNWLNDPIVVAARDIYLKTVVLCTPLLDREQLAAKVLAIADEKILINGVMRSTIEPKDRVAALKLYSDIAGYTGKVEIDNSTKTFNEIKELTIKLVKGQDKPQVTIDNAPNKNVKSEISNVENTPITLKLVGGAAR